MFKGQSPHWCLCDLCHRHDQNVAHIFYLTSVCVLGRWCEESRLYQLSCNRLWSSASQSPLSPWGLGYTTIRAYTASQRQSEQPREPREPRLLDALLPPGLGVTIPSLDRVADSGVHCSSVSGKYFQNYCGSLETKEKEEWRHLTQPLPGPPHTPKYAESRSKTHSGFWNKLMFHCQTDSERE